MQVRCPSCHVPFQSAQDTSWNDLVCPSCGSEFNLAGMDATCTFRPGARVLRHFELVEQVGAGRFGSVWKARDTQLQRIVAVKIPRERDLDANQTELFFRDARAAAQLKHPRIAGVHEVGREDGTIYIVTDYIDGANLGEWLTGQRLTSREAAELVVKIAEALQHAHEAGVVHRDLKPSNVMIDRDGEPHVIDFGLARRETGEVTMTVEGQVLGTPAYMSPEQARGEGHWADRRSDVYSLGVILFELSTGELPFRGEARMLIVQILDEEAPSPRKLNANIQHDLDTITLKCLEKEPAKRYQTAQELADDLKRYLAGEAIHARPVGRVERSLRWCKRNRAVAGLMFAVFTILAAGVVTSSYFAASASREAKGAIRSLEEAELQRKRAERVNAFFMDEVFGLADPNSFDRAGISLTEALDIAAPRIEDRFADDPELQVVIRARLGEVYTGIDEPDKAIEQLEKAVALWSGLAGPMDPRTLKSRSSLGMAHFNAGRSIEAKELLRSTSADQSKVLGAGHPEAVETASRLGTVLMVLHDDTDLAHSEQTYRQALEALGPRHFSTLDAQCTFAWILRWRGRNEQALEHAKVAAIGLREVVGKGNVRAMFATYNYGSCLIDAGRFEEAAAELGPLLEIRERVYGPAHVDTLYAAWRLADALRLSGKETAALAVLENVHSHLDEIQATSTWRRAGPLSWIARAFAVVGRSDRAAEVAAAIYKIHAGALKGGRPAIADSLMDFVELLETLTEERARNRQWAVELATKACELSEYKNPSFLDTLATAHAVTGDFDLAAKWIEKSLELKPDNVKNHYFRAILRLRGGDWQGYRSACAAMLEQFKTTTDQETAFWLAWTCGLGDQALDDLSTPLKLIQDLVEKEPLNPRYVQALGPLLYRTGGYEEAAKRLTEAIAACASWPTEQSTVLYPQLFLAMANWRLGQAVEARSMLAELQAALDEAIESPTITWTRRATLELLRREAEALIASGNSPAAATK